VFKVERVPSLSIKRQTGAQPDPLQLDLQTPADIRRSLTNHASSESLGGASVPAIGPCEFRTERFPTRTSIEYFLANSSSEPTCASLESAAQDRQHHRRNTTIPVCRKTA
jgi:hypothetical protein